MLGCISLIDSREEIEPKRFYKISLIDIADLTGVANSTSYNELPSTNWKDIDAPDVAPSNSGVNESSPQTLNEF